MLDKPALLKPFRSQLKDAEVRQAAIASLMRLRFGSVDSELQAIIPALMNLPTEEYTQLLWQLSREALLQRFSDSR